VEKGKYPAPLKYPFEKGRTATSKNLTLDRKRGRVMPEKGGDKDLSKTIRRGEDTEKRRDGEYQGGYIEGTHYKSRPATARIESQAFTKRVALEKKNTGAPPRRGSSGVDGDNATKGRPGMKVAKLRKARTHWNDLTTSLPKIRSGGTRGVGVEDRQLRNKILR